MAEARPARDGWWSGGAGRWLRRLAIVLALAYPLALLIVVVGLRLVGESWWLTTLLLYLPRLGFGLPLLVLAPALVLVRAWRWLPTQAVALVILAGPLMGLHVGGPRAPTPGATRLRVMTWNIDFSFHGLDDLAAAIRASDADIVCLQEARGDELEGLRSRVPAYTWSGTGQFIVATRYRISEVHTVPWIVVGDEHYDPNFVRFRVEVPGGPIDLYSIHPVSPHSAFDRLRGEGLLHELATGRFFVNHAGFQKLEMNAAVRVAQARAIAEDAATAPDPVLIVGDTNLPSLSRALAASFGRYHDGFAEVGRGWGYTYPARRVPAWIRLDRVLADDHFRFLEVRRLDARGSTHYALVADLERAPVAR